MTYSSLAGLFLIGCILVAGVCRALVRPSRRWHLAGIIVALVLVVLTAVFDSAMIAADLFRFDEQSLAGPRVGLAPVEDFAWPLAAALLLPALWEALGRRRSRRAPGAGSRPTPRAGARPGAPGERPVVERVAEDRR